VDRPGKLKVWAERVLREGIGVGAAFRECQKKGYHGERARDLAEEAVQEALARASRLAEKVEAQITTYEHFCNWLRKVAINHVRDVSRRRKKEIHLTKEGWEAVVGPVAEPPPDTAAVCALVNELPAVERCLLLLHSVDGLTLDELAERLLPPDDRTENARRLDIWRRLRRIRRRLRERLLKGGFIPPGEDILFDDTAAETARRGNRD
jgi:DNA-directed RNA polymerase specialized sigma24 family protein